jgi:hypothetical protein
MPTSGNAYRPDGRGFPAPAEGFVGTHLIFVTDQDRSRGQAAGTCLSSLLDRSIAGQCLVGLQLVYDSLPEAT